MAQNKSRNRVQSAKPHTDRQRPLSSRPTRINEKTGLLQKVYANIPPLHQRPSSGRQKAKISSVFLPYYMTSDIGGLQKQALVEENIQLKKKVHILQEQMTQMHGKFQASRVKQSKLKKTLNVEFQNENLWTGNNAYMVAGVKNQYEKLKSQHKQKCEQLAKLQQTNHHTVMKQLEKENQILKRQNNNLIQNYLKQEMKYGILDNSSEFIHDSSGRQLKASQIVLAELREKFQQLEQKLHKRNTEISTLKENLEITNSRIKFLQKLIIQKDNSLHALNSKNKKLQKQKNFFTQHLESLNQKLKELEEQNQQKVKKIQQIEAKKVQKQRQIYTKAIEQKNFTINKLEKEVAYLTTLMSYWKPLDEQQKKAENIQKQKNRKQMQRIEEEEKKKKAVKVSESLGVLGKVFSQKMVEQAEKKQKSQQLMRQPRQQKRADVKRSEDVKKVRKVKDSQVKEIGQLIRFRLIAQRIPIDAIKNYFNYKEHETVSVQDREWQIEYISIKQLVQILKTKPFILSQQQAVLFSRYMIEDILNDFVYFDEQNQNKREIVKSILKNSIGEYKLEKELSQIQAETKIELEKYQKRISIILQQVQKDGLITKKKLIQNILGSGFEIQQDILDFMIGSLAMESESLQKLKYGVLF